MADENHKTIEIFVEPFYMLSEQAHSELRNAEECMVLLSLLTQSRAEEPIIPMSRWTSVFHIVGNHMRDVLDAAPWHEGV